MQNMEARFSELADRISELVRNINRGPNPDGTNNSQQNFAPQPTERNEGRTVLRYAKLDFPSFDGFEDPLDGLIIVSNFFTTNILSRETRLAWQPFT